MNRREALKSLAALGLGTAAGRAAAASGTAASSRPVRITLPSAGSAGSVWRPLIDQNHFDQGLDLHWVTADPGSMQVQLTAGSLDVGVFGAVGLATLASKGSDIVLFGPALNNHGRWLVKANSPYRTPRDLIGKAIASTAETSETWQQALIAAHLDGLDLHKDFKVIHGSPTANLALFQRGDVEAIVTLEPTASRLVGQGAREIARVADIWKHATGERNSPPLVGLAASRRWLDANRDTAQRIVTMFVEVNRFVHQHPQSLTQIATQIGLKSDETAAAALLPQRLADAYATTWDAETFATIDRQIDTAASIGILARKPDRKIYTQLS
ncbi:ABC transporter substrate-binding protein [Paraburkholderia lycopersici]|uniref:NitT/TauT family transport system substrate-binding protein n=1 Tax=Paraburkholderia lycopersici TaxID=416944 RepID=A0A1G7BH93_9BURK|nr:ABC transporter substrate-binding protein [Paraburkholderia lycopersici]SDE26481.1 NitT/TauT family transport system substrate-binding protein [Paraburkholderia lycopersici]